MKTAWISCLVTAGVLLVCLPVRAANYRTDHFYVTACTPELAAEIGKQAEYFRRTLAVEWLGGELGSWDEPCPIWADVDPHLQASGRTSYVFRDGRPRAWSMQLRGPRQAICESVLPHEIAHTVFATYFGRPLPRWAEEGICVSVEDPSEQAKLQQLLPLHYQRGKLVALAEVVDRLDYPSEIVPLYAQGYSMVSFLVSRGGKRHFVQFLEAALHDRNWPEAARSYYGYPDLGTLHQEWLTWALATPAGVEDAVAVGAE